MTTEIVTNLIILATALVGLYKAATYVGEKGKNKGSGHKYSDEFLRILFSAVSILIVPAVMLGFMYLLNIYTTQLLGSSFKYEIPKKASDAEKMYLISEKFWKQDLRQEALKKTIERALETGQYEVVLKAAKDLNPTSQADGVLMRAIDKLSGAKNKTTNAAD